MPKWLKKDYLKGKCDKNDYMTLYIFDTKQEMYRYSTKYLSDSSIDYMARTMCETRLLFDGNDNFAKYSNNCGYLCFNLEEFGVITVSHEVAHAILGYFNRKIENYKDLFFDGFYLDEELPNWRDLVDYNIEEVFCYMVGNLNDQIWEYYFKIQEEKGGNV